MSLELRPSQFQLSLSPFWGPSTHRPPVAVVTNKDKMPLSHLPLEYPSMGFMPTGIFTPTLFPLEGQQIIPLLWSGDDKPLELWDKQLRNGQIQRTTDEDLPILAVEITSSENDNTFICCPACPLQTLGIRLPMLSLFVKNMERHFFFIISIKDDTRINRRLMFSTRRRTKKLSPLSAIVGMKLRDGWNELQINLPYHIRALFGTTYVESRRLEVHGSCRIRLIYFSAMTEEDAENTYPQIEFFVTMTANGPRLGSRSVPPS